MDRLEQPPGADAVGSGERPARSQHAGDLSEHRVLQRGGGDVVEHREADDAGEAAVGKRQRGRVALDDFDPVAEITS